MKSYHMLRLFVLLTLVAGLAAAEGLDRRIIERVKASTVYLEVHGANFAGSGSGWIMDNGLIVTNAHVVGQSADQSLKISRIQGTFNTGESNEVKQSLSVVAVSVPADLAFLKPTDSRVRLPRGLELIRSTQLEETMPVWIFGFPFGEAIRSREALLAPTIGNGTISKLVRARNDRDFILEIQVNGDLNPGNSGGPIVDRRGRVVAVAKETVLAAQIGFGVSPDILGLALGGIPTSRTVSVAKVDDSGITFETQLMVCDPLEQFRRIRRGYFYADPGAERPTREIDGHTFELHGARGDSPIVWTELKRSEDGSYYSGEHQGIKLPDGKELVFILSLDRKGVAGRVHVDSRITAAALHNLQNAATGTGSAAGGGPQPDAGSAERGLAPNPGPPPAQQPPSRSPWQARSLPKPASTREPVAGETKIVRVNDVTPTRFPLVVSQMQFVHQLSETDPLAYTASLDGATLFVIFEDRSEVWAYDTANLQADPVVIPTPRLPVSLHVGDRHLFVRCPESHLILMIDPQTRQPVNALANPFGGGAYQPEDFWGPAGDGYYYGAWLKKGDAWWDRHHFRYDPKSFEPTYLGKDSEFRLNPLWPGMYLRQSSFTGSPSGTLSHGPVGERRPYQEMLPDPKSLPHMPRELSSWHTSVLPVVYGVAGKEIFLTMLDYNQPAITQRMDHRLQLSGTPFMGQVIGFAEGGKRIISWHRKAPSWLEEQLGRQLKEVHTVRLVDGRSSNTLMSVVAEVGRPYREQRRARNSPPAYIPGRDEVIVLVSRDDDREDRSQPAKTWALAVMPVGNFEEVNETGGGSPASQASFEPPPISGKVGQLLSWQAPPSDSDARYSLHNPQPGMAIDERSGRWTWTPSAWQLGTYDVEIIMSLGDSTSGTLQKWQIKIDK